MIKSIYIDKTKLVEILPSFFSGILINTAVFTKAFIDLSKKHRQIIK